MNRFTTRTFILAVVSIALGFILAWQTRDAGLVAAFASVITAAGGIYAAKRVLEDKNKVQR